MTTLPPALRRLLTIFGWLWPLLWPLAVASMWVFPARGVVLTTGAAMMSTTCHLVLTLSDAAERNVQRRLEAFQAEKSALIVGFGGYLGETATKPQPALREPLKAVQN